ncbi:hypothetical protein MCOR22_009481 [Pyricularia oryzae]|nr:hypothetical protein MCOR22_009481 [Pyricularia oryzae]
MFKTNPRSHIGYLVGYRATRIYHIWVPSFDKIITSRNVRFNESCFYKGPEQEAKETGKLTDEYELLINTIHEPNLESLNTGVTEKLGLLQNRPTLTPDPKMLTPGLEGNNVQQQLVRGAEESTEPQTIRAEVQTALTPAQPTIDNKPLGGTVSQPESSKKHIQTEADEPRKGALVAPKRSTVLENVQTTSKAGDDIYHLGVRTPSSTGSPPQASAIPSETLHAPRPTQSIPEAEPDFGTVETAHRIPTPN